MPAAPVFRFRSSSAPATMPATCVPCPYPSSPRPRLRLRVKSTLTITLSASALCGEMPESTMATPMPEPSTAPSDATRPDHAESAPVVVVVSAMCPVTTALADTACTSGSAVSASSMPAGTSSTAPRRSRRFSCSG